VIHGEIHQNVRQYINGRWETSATTGVSANPSDTSEVVAEYARADRRQAELAMRAATEAFPHWSHSTPQRRADVLDRIGAELLARKDDLGLLLAREEGKTLPEAVAEVARAGQVFKFFAGEALRGGAGGGGGENIASVRAGVQVDVTREPVGVVGLITPWNSPFVIPAWKIAPALAHGNSVVFKPAELVPACGWALAEIISRAALPAGAFNLVMGSGREVGQALVDSALVDALSFTGSAANGERVLQAAATRRAKVQLEMGGKNALVVLADADLDRAVDCAVQGAYFSAGQRCTASSRLIVEAPVHDAFVARLRQRLKDTEDRPRAGARRRHRPGGRRRTPGAEPGLGRHRARRGRRARVGRRGAGACHRRPLHEPRAVSWPSPRTASRARKSSGRWPACCAPTTTTTRWPCATTRPSACARASAPTR
jgi:acyl-CoA reductase-like NAD-dependent aldehyde dehydrogenase